MYKIALILILGLFTSEDPGWTPDREIAQNTPHESPREIMDLWLRYHEEELCQKLDGVFVFHRNSLEFWCRVEDEKSYEKFAGMVDPIRKTVPIEIYATQPTDAENQESESRSLPPSLWNNSELRNYLQDPFGRTTSPDVIARPAGNENEPGYFLKQRMIMFADQTLAFGSEMKGYAADLPALAYVGSLPGAPEDIRARATAIALKHAQELDERAERLIENLSQAMPRTARRSGEPKASTRSRVPIVQSASQLSILTQNTGRRIYRFIYPQHHTVGLSDLREPGLLESLRVIRHLASDFQRLVKDSARP
jgi:hypothetical protein